MKKRTGPVGIEPTTFRLTAGCSGQLSYGPFWYSGQEPNICTTKSSWQAPEVNCCIPHAQASAGKGDRAWAYEFQNINFQMSTNTVVTGNINVANQINVMNMAGRKKRAAEFARQALDYMARYNVIIAALPEAKARGHELF